MFNRRPFARLSHTSPRACSSRCARLVRLRCLRLRAKTRRAYIRYVLLPIVRASTAIYLAAGALIGFEVLEVLFGAFVLAPELLPVLILSLAVHWYLREHLRRAARLARLWLRRARRRRAPSAWH